MRTRVNFVHALQLICIAVTTNACVSLAHPGRYTPPGETAAAQASSLSATLDWRGDDPKVRSELAKSFRTHLERSKLFAKLDPKEDADLHLKGFASRMCEPYTVFPSKMKCMSLPSFGYSGMNVLISVITVGIWPAVSILGVPTDWGQGQAELTIHAQDPASSVVLKRWTSGLVTETAYAGLYYSFSPLSESLEAAATKLLSRMRPDLPALQKRLKSIRSWREHMSVSQALRSPEAAVRVRALRVAEESELREIVRLAADEHELVREGVIRALVSLNAKGPSVRGALRMLAKDSRPKVQYAARNALRDLELKAIAQEVQNPEVSRWILKLNSSEERQEALAQLQRYGPKAAPALPFLLGLLGSRPNAPVVDTIVAISMMTPKVEAALKKQAKMGVRSARLALSQLEVQQRAPPEPVGLKAPELAQDAIVAVFAISGAKLKRRDRSALTDMLAAHLTSIRGFRVVPQDALRKRLKTGKRDSYRQCYDQSCQIEVGKALAAQKVLSTKLDRVGGACVVTSSLYDLRTEAAERAAVVHSKCGMRALSRAMEEVANKLSR